MDPNEWMLIKNGWERVGEPARPDAHFRFSEYFDCADFRVTFFQNDRCPAERKPVSGKKETGTRTAKKRERARVVESAREEDVISLDVQSGREAFAAVEKAFLFNQHSDMPELNYAQRLRIAQFFSMWSTFSKQAECAGDEMALGQFHLRRWKIHDSDYCLAIIDAALVVPSEPGAAEPAAAARHMCSERNRRRAHAELHCIDIQTASLKELSVWSGNVQADMSRLPLLEICIERQSLDDPTEGANRVLRGCEGSACCMQ